MKGLYFTLGIVYSLSSIMKAGTVTYSLYIQCSVYNRGSISTDLFQFHIEQQFMTFGDLK